MDSERLSVFQLVVQLEKGGVQTVATEIHEQLNKRGANSKICFVYPKFEPENQLVLLRRRTVNPFLIFKGIRRLFNLAKDSKVIVLHTDIALFFGLLLSARSRQLIYVQHNRSKLNGRIRNGAVSLVRRCLKNLVSVSVFPINNKGYLYIPNQMPQLRLIENKRIHSPIRIIAVGRFSTEKNIKFIANNIPNNGVFHLHIVGDGSEKADLEKLLSKRFESNLYSLTSNISREQVLNLMSSSDIMVSASSTEGLPMTLLEASSTGLPMVLSKIEGHELFLSQGFAIGFGPNDNEDFVKAISKMAMSYKRYAQPSNFTSFHSQQSMESDFSNWLNLFRKYQNR